MNGSDEAFIFSGSWMLVRLCTLSHPQMINLASWDVVTGTGVPQLERFLRISDEKYINAISTTVVLEGLGTYLV